MFSWLLSLLLLRPLPPEPSSVQSSSSVTLTLRHIHGTSNRTSLLHDVRPDQFNLLPTAALESYTLKTRLMTTHKPSSYAAFTEARRRSIRREVSTKEDELLWGQYDVPGPDVTDRETLQLLAKMTNNAYLNPGEPEWYPLGDHWNPDYPFGWEPDEDGFRGHVFASADNRTVVVSIKGTSAGLFGGGGPTARKDKLNDNLLFSCCCARVDWSWTTVCDCYGGGWRCDDDCASEALIDESLFYPLGTNLYNGLAYLYPNANIWMSGHSLGGALAGLLGTTFGSPTVAFEAPGERMAARRLHLPTPPSTQHVTHVYHTGDPIPMGACTGVLSSCAIGGYALESRCHLGQTILYDTVSKYGWGVDIRTHRINIMIDKLLNEDWETDENGRGVVPAAKPEDDCVECYSWEYGKFANTSTSPRRASSLRFQLP